MFKGPGKVVTPNDDTSFADFKDFHREGEESHFKYNPAASDITKQSGDFPETGSYDPPEKM
jgi:hypothetical protein